MTVSLLVGTVRTLAHYTESPGEILSAMNQRMIGRTKVGFTTCLILRVRPDGAMAIASAGHQMPYVDGREIAGDTGLPLGILADTTYVETAGRLRECAQLTLITDGVIEARDKSGELFGFDRTTAISAQSAEQIAAHAQQFGQEDDITVVTLTRESPAGSTAVCLAEPEAATSPA
jgi:serine phosphatase RsbU (regulator of sigma subunit)